MVVLGHSVYVDGVEFFFLEFFVNNATDQTQAKMSKRVCYFESFQ